MTHITLAPKLRQGLAAQAVLEAQKRWGFRVTMVQADNGPEYSRYFELSSFHILQHHVSTQAVS